MGSLATYWRGFYPERTRTTRDGINQPSNHTSAVPPLGRS